MTRIRIINRAEMNAEQGRVYDEAKAAGNPVGGPYYAYIRNPRLMRAAQEMGNCLRDSSLSGRERQIAVLTAIRHWGAKYPWAVQVRGSLTAGVDQATIDAINAKKAPNLPNARERLAYEVATELLDEARAQRRDLRGRVPRLQGRRARGPRRGRRAVLDGVLHRQRLRHHAARRCAGAARGLRRHAMAQARHAVPPEIAALSIEQIADRYIGRFRDKVPDWDAFEDAKVEGYPPCPASLRRRRRFGQARRSQHHPGARLHAQHHPSAARPGQRPAHPRGRRGVLRPQGHPRPSSSRTRRATASRASSAPGNASPARRASFMASRMTASSRSGCRSCSAAAGPRRWAMPTTSSSVAAKPISRRGDGGEARLRCARAPGACRLQLVRQRAARREAEPLSTAPTAKRYRAARSVRPHATDAIRRWFARVDADHDGAISLGEFMADARRQFGVMDLEHTGVLTPAVLAQYRAPYLTERQRS